MSQSAGTVAPRCSRLTSSDTAAAPFLARARPLHPGSRRGRGPGQAAPCPGPFLDPPVRHPTVYRLTRHVSACRCLGLGCLGLPVPRDQGGVARLERMEESLVDPPCAAVREHMAVPAGVCESRVREERPHGLSFKVVAQQLEFVAPQVAKA